MPIRNDIFLQGQYYHIYNRGAGKAKIFYCEQNYKHLLGLIAAYSEKYGAQIIAYCLMPNHYHFLIRQETEDPLSHFIQVLFNSYVQALNQERGRTGTLFEGRFRHKRVDKSSYLIYLCRYIHRNPVKAGLVKSPEDWPFSNYRELIGAGNNGLKNEEFIKDHFCSADEYRVFVCEEADDRKDFEKIKKYVLD